MSMKFNSWAGVLCKFGPGGDFVWLWPGKAVKIPVQKGLAKLGNLLNDILTVVAGCSADVNLTGINNTDTREALNPTLFSDDKCADAGIQHAHKHRIHINKTIKKRSSHIDLPGQGELFADNIKSVRTA